MATPDDVAEWTRQTQWEALRDCAQAQCRVSMCFDAFCERARTASHPSPWLQRVTHAKLVQARQALLAACLDVAKIGAPDAAPVPAPAPAPIAPPTKATPPLPIPVRRRPRARDAAPRSIPAAAAPYAGKTAEAAPYAGKTAEATLPPAGQPTLEEAAEAVTDALHRLINDVLVVEPIPGQLGHDALIAHWFTDVLLHGLQHGLVQCAAHKDMVDTALFYQSQPTYASLATHEEATQRDMAARFRRFAPEFLERPRGIAHAMPYMTGAQFQWNLLHNMPLEGDVARTAAATAIVRPMNLPIDNAGAGDAARGGLQGMLPDDAHSFAIFSDGLAQGLALQDVGYGPFTLAKTVLSCGVPSAIIAAAALGVVPWVVHAPVMPVEGQAPFVDDGTTLWSDTDGRALVAEIRRMLERSAVARQVRVAPPRRVAWATDISRYETELLGHDLTQLPAVRTEPGFPGVSVLRDMLRSVARTWLDQSPRLRQELLPDWLEQAGLKEHGTPLDVLTGVLDMTTGLCVVDAVTQEARPMEPPHPPATALVLDQTVMQAIGATLLYHDTLALVVEWVTGPAGAELARRRGDDGGLDRWKTLGAEFHRELRDVHALPAWLRRIQLTLTHVLRTATVHDVPIDTGSFFAWPALAVDVIRLDVVALVARCNILVPWLVRDYLWRWRQTALKDAAIVASSHWTMRVLARVKDVLARVEHPRPTAVNDSVGLARGPTILWDGFLASACEQLGVMCVGAAAMGSLLAAAGVPYRWSLARSMVVQCALRGQGVPIAALRAMMTEGARRLEEHVTVRFADLDVGGSVCLLHWVDAVGIDQVARAARGHSLLTQWLQQVLATRLDRTSHSNVFDAWRDAAPRPFNEREDTAVVERLITHLDPGLAHNAWRFFYMLRQRAAYTDAAS